MRLLRVAAKAVALLGMFVEMAWARRVLRASGVPHALAAHGQDVRRDAPRRLPNHRPMPGISHMAGSRLFPRWAVMT